MIRALAGLPGVICLLPFAISAQNPATPAITGRVSIEGRIVNALDNEPVLQANVTLLPGPAEAGDVAGGPSARVKTESDSTGRFKFENLEPGRYSISAGKSGFLGQRYGNLPGVGGQGRVLIGGPGQKIQNLEIKLIPEARLSGRVLNEEGEPVARAYVQLFRQSAYFRQPFGGHRTRTNSAGEFLIGDLAPGAYFILVYPPRSLPAPSRQNVSGKAYEDAYVTTFYPDTTDRELAVPIIVSAGQEVLAVSIRLRRVPVYRVRGVVKGTGITANPGGEIDVSLDPHSQGGRTSMGVGRSVSTRPDGSFEFSAVQPGSYFLRPAEVPRQKFEPRVIWPKMPITVTDENVEGVVLQADVPPLTEITGRVKLEGDDQAKTTGKVSLWPAEELGTIGAVAGIERDGIFRFEAVHRGKYYVSVIGLSEGIYLKQVRSGSYDVLERGLDLSMSGWAPPLEVLVSPKAATIEGVLRHEDEPWPGASLTLLPAGGQPERIQWRQRAATSDQNGRFTLKGIAPGEYRLYAWKEVVPLAEIDPQEVRPYEAQSLKIKLSEGERRQVELKLVRPLQ